MADQARPNENDNLDPSSVFKKNLLENFIYAFVRNRREQSTSSAVPRLNLAFKKHLQSQEIVKKKYYYSCKALYGYSAFKVYCLKKKTQHEEAGVGSWTPARLNGRGRDRITSPLSLH